MAQRRTRQTASRASVPTSLPRAEGISELGRSLVILPLATGFTYLLCLGASSRFGQSHAWMPLALAATGGTAVFGLHVASILAQKQQRTLLQKQQQVHQTQIQRERYLRALVEAKRLLLADESGQGHDTVLGLLGEASQCDRVYLSQVVTQNEEASATLLAEWCAPGTTGQINNPARTDLPLSRQLPRWLATLNKGQKLYGSAADFPEEERRFLETQGIFTTLILPLIINEELWGYVGFESRQRPRVWTTEELAYLDLAAEAIMRSQSRRNNEQNTLQQALHDPLTGLSNRRRLREQLERWVARAQKNQTSLVVIYLDLDRFKQINDTLGHAFGDRFLQFVVRRRLIPCISPKDLLARVGGDEFVLVMNEPDHPDIVNGAAKMAESLLKSLTEPIHLEGQELVISTSIGISRFPTDGTDADTLLKNADVAMYRAKEEGRGDFRFFTPQMNQTSKERFELEAELRHDLTRPSRNDSFALFYQPQVDLRSKKMTGVEALVRWRNAKRGLVSPSKFVPIAEETGLVQALSEWVLTTACTQGAQWAQAGFPLKVAVNLSAQQLRNRELPQQVGEVLAQTGLPPQYLELELTETALLHDVPGALVIMNALKQMGVILSLDDFGAGYSSLSHLRQCPFDVVKIDRSFVRSIVGSVRDQMLVKMLIGLAHDLGMTVVAEGIETTAQCEILLSLGCQHFQGYLFSPPIPAEDLEGRFLQPAKAA